MIYRVWLRALYHNAAKWLYIIELIAHEFELTRLDKLLEVVWALRIHKFCDAAVV